MPCELHGAGTVTSAPCGRPRGGGRAANDGRPVEAPDCSARSGGPGGERQPTRQVDGHLAGPRGRMVVAGRHALVRELVQSIMLIFSCTAAPLGDMLGIFAIKRSDAHDT